MHWRYTVCTVSIGGIIHMNKCTHGAFLHVSLWRTNKLINCTATAMGQYTQYLRWTFGYSFHVSSVPPILSHGLLVCFFFFFLSLSPPPPSRYQSPHVPRELLCSVYGPPLPPQHQPGPRLHHQSLDWRKSQGYEHRVLSGCPPLHQQSRSASTAQFVYTLLLCFINMTVECHPIKSVIRVPIPPWRKKSCPVGPGHCHWPMPLL